MTDFLSNEGNHLTWLVHKYEVAKINAMLLCESQLTQKILLTEE